jgi:hypothetical protein
MMSTFNRVVIVILLLVAIVICSAFLIVPAVLDTLVRQLAALNDFLAGLEWYQRIPLGVLFAAALNVVFILLIIFEVRRPAPKAIRVERASGGEVTISVASIADRLKFEIDQLPGVLQVKPRVSARRRGVQVELDVQAAAGINVPATADRVAELAREVVEGKIGLKLARSPKLNIRTVAYPRVPLWRAAPEEEVTATATELAPPEEETEEEPDAEMDD